MGERNRGERAAWGGLGAVRIGLPGVIAWVGLMFVLVGHGDLPTLGGALIGVSAIVVIANLYARLSMRSQHDREQEAAARRQLSRTGRWPPP
jgi:hypothetical protein